MTSNLPRNNPEGPSSGSDRVNRGGGWESIPGGLRAAGRRGAGGQIFNLDTSVGSPVQFILTARRRANIFDEHEKVTIICQRGYKSEVAVELRCRRVFCMNGERAHPDNIGDLQRAS